MNTATAIHLNALRSLARPVVFDRTTLVVIQRGPNENFELADLSTDQSIGFAVRDGRVARESAAVKALVVPIVAILRQCEPAALALEIRNAAAERREAESAGAIRDSQYWFERTYDYAYARNLWTFAAPQIAALIDSDNARRVANYEVYRLACEQGVAVPPTA